MAESAGPDSSLTEGESERTTTYDKDSSSAEGEDISKERGTNAIHRNTGKSHGIKKKKNERR